MVTSTASADLLTALRERRSIYGITKDSPVSNTDIEDLIHEVIQHTPSAFNSQSTRIVLLLGRHHDELWDITTGVLRAVVPSEQFASTEQRMKGFQNGYGTVLFFEDQAVIEGLQQKYPLYQDNFPIWSQHTNGMHQLVMWMGLESLGFGANLQHYNPLIDEKVKAEWGLPEHWKLIAQMPFGKPSAPAGDKEFQPVEARCKIFK